MSQYAGVGMTSSDWFMWLRFSWYVAGRMFAWLDAHAGSVGIVIGLLTLGAVGRQIMLARQALQLASEELSAVKEDLDNNRKMVERAFRQSKFELVWNTTRNTVAYAAFEADKGWCSVPDLRAVNRGSLTSREVNFKFYLPTQYFNAYVSDALEDEVFNGVPHKVAQVTLGTTIFPTRHAVFRFPFIVTTGGLQETIKIYWEAFDEFGRHPHEGYTLLVLYGR